MSLGRSNLEIKNTLWLSQKIILYLTLFLCLTATLAMGVLYRYMNKELNYVSSILVLQKNYSAAFPNLLDMQLTQQNFLKNKSDAQYYHFLAIQQNINKIIRNINDITNIAPELKNCADEFAKAINNETNILKKNMDIIKQANNNNFSGLDKATESFTKIINSFINKENASLQAHNKSINQIKHLFMLSGLVFIFSILIFTYAISAYFANDIKILKHTQNKLNELNNELEHKVHERTDALEHAKLHAEKERHRVELLLQDTSHRIGNSLATVASLLGIQSRRSENEQVQHALNSARDRIQTIAAAHRRLRLGSDMETTNLNEFLQSVIHDIEFSMPTDVKKRISIIPDLHNYFCSSRDATTLGIVMGELLTNAIKHAFPNSKQGEIQISLKKNIDNKLKLIIHDNGIGLSEKDNSTKIKPGLGLLVAKQLCMQFNCEPIYEKDNGTKVIIDLSSIALRD